MSKGNVTSPDSTGGLAPALVRNIAALRERSEAEQARTGIQTRIADAITAFAGSMHSIYIHLAAFGAWIAINLGLTPMEPWDPSLVMLATAASIEAIFLSTFVLISQNRMARAAQHRADLDLQTGLLTEHEVTKLIAITSAIAGKLGVPVQSDPEIAELKENVAPERVLDRIEEEDAKRERHG